MTENPPETEVARALGGLERRAAGHGRPRLLVTAGPTAEDIDAVRFITNRSTGRMGLSLTAAAAARGWPVLLVLGPTPLAPPGVPEGQGPPAVVRVRSAAQMAAAVTAALGWVDALVMAAAVADYTPAEPVAGKLKKSAGDLALRLRRTVDILEAVRRHPLRRAPDDGNAPLPEGRRLRAVIGFSLGVDDDPAEGRRKLAQKGLDGIVVNTTSSFGASSEKATLLRADGTVHDFGEIDKDELARALLDELAAILDRTPV